MEYFNKAQANKLRTKIQNAESEVNRHLGKLRAVVFGTDEALRTESEIRLIIYEAGTEEYCNSKHNAELKATTLPTAEERARIASKYADLKRTINSYLAPVRRTLADYPFSWSVVDGRFSFDEEAKDRYIKNKCTYPLVEEMEEYLAKLLQLQSLALEIEAYERKNKIEPYVIEGRLLNTGFGGVVQWNVMEDIKQHRNPDDFRTFLVEQLAFKSRIY